MDRHEASRRSVLTRSNGFCGCPIVSLCEGIQSRVTGHFNVCCFRTSSVRFNQECDVNHSYVHIQPIWFVCYFTFITSYISVRIGPVIVNNLIGNLQTCSLWYSNDGPKVFAIDTGAVRNEKKGCQFPVWFLEKPLVDWLRNNGTMSSLMSSSVSN